MKSLEKFFIILLVFLVSISFALGLAVSGKQTGFKLDFIPNHTQTNEYFITNKEGYTSDYDITTKYLQGADLTEYFTITPNRIEGVKSGESARFQVTLNLPEEAPDVPGESRTWVRVKIDPSRGGFRAYPSIAISYYIFILFPYKYIEWNLNTPSLNINETRDFKVIIENLGEPVIDSAYADIVITNKETNQTVDNLRTNVDTIEPREEAILKAAFDSFGLAPGNYEANATLYWDNNVSNQVKDFRIGSKDVKILNFTKLFESDAINQMDIIIESAWNTKIHNIYADIEIFDIETDQTVAEFKSLNTELNPWQNKKLLAYFDTSGLANNDYRAKITLRYEGARREKEGIITIGDDINAKTVEEIPGKFSFSKINFSGILTTMNLLILLLIFFIALNAYLAVGFLRKKKRPKEVSEEVEEIDQAVIDHVKEMKKKYKDEYIEEMMVKKGWPKKKVEKILKKAK